MFIEKKRQTELNHDVTIVKKIINRRIVEARTFSSSVPRHRHLGRAVPADR